MQFDAIQKPDTAISKEHLQAHRYGLASVDMREAIQYLNCYDQIRFIYDKDDDPQWAVACRGLLSAAIVAYCRPFSENKSEGFAVQRLAAKRLTAVQERRALHDLLIEKRNTFIAHADWTARHAQITEVKPFSVTWDFPQPNVWEGLDVGEFRHLAGGVSRECLRKGMALAQIAHDIPSVYGESV